MVFFPGGAAVTDPYASLSYPSYDKTTAKVFPTNGTVLPGVYSGAIQGAVTMQPGIYYVDAATFGVNGSGSLDGAGVTIVLVDLNNKLKSNSNLTMINGNSPVRLTAPTSGDTAGVVIFAERSLNSKITFNGGSSQSFTGAIYMPGVDFTFVGGTANTGCTQVIADQVTFNGTANLALNCSGTSVQPLTLQIAELVE
jgi:hypothetical protein